MSTVVYPVDSKPPFLIATFAGIQHVLTLFGSTTLVPFLIGNAMGMDTLQLTSLLSCVYLGMGICTLLQTSIIGSRLPIVQGSSFSFLVPILTIIGIYATESPNVVMQYLGGGLIVGGILQALIGYTGLIGYIKKLITPVVIAPTIMAIGFSLSGTAISSASTFWPISILTVVLIFTFSLISKNKHINIFSIILSLGLVYAICLFLSGIGVFTNTHPAFVDISKIANASWLRDLHSVIIPWGIPKFDIIVIVTLFSGFFAGMIESIGDYHSISYSANLDDPSSETIAKGIGSEGVGMILSGFFGSVGSTSYTENIGLVNLTGMASRYVVQLGALFLILISFIGKFSAVVASIPTCVMGGAYIVLFALIGSSGISIFSRADMKSQRNLLIIGVAFLMALGLPSWVDANKALFINDSYNTVVNVFGSILWSLLKSSMAVAGICAVIFDSIIPGTNDERGIN